MKALVVFTCLGVLLVEPFHARTIEKDPFSAHGVLQETPYRRGSANQRQLHYVHNTCIMYRLTCFSRTLRFYLLTRA
ncbi:hypothetical protein DPMN_086031 [Dreissena polymorpha]|uniref:Uncharacterized protein n=1 Tax=Dreissena polymorpha TaxID=45954 RepID=A0A9D3YI37_DREPO|nr:hypothetical protein DPMN_086031 [Dreissena polymorpha]